MSRSLIVVVELTAKIGVEAELLALVTRQAQRTLQAEPECSRFDVCVDDQDGSRILLYEHYASSAAFAAHLETQHYVEFAAASKPLLQQKSVRRFRTTEDGS